MLEYRLSQQTIDRFLKEYGDNVVLDTNDRMLMHCIFPNHDDRNRSAVLYKASGIYHCPSCGSHHISKILGKVEIELEPSYRVLKSNNPTINWDYDIDKFHFRIADEGKIIRYVNSSKDGKEMLGWGYRTEVEGGRRKYFSYGKPGFRLFAPVLTESLSDAIFLLNRGINAGSICSVSNIHNARSGVYLPQNDAAGLRAVGLLPPTVFCFSWMFYVGVNKKDIRELNEDEINFILHKLEPYKIVV